MRSKNLGSDQLMYGSVLTLLVFHKFPLHSGGKPGPNMARDSSLVQPQSSSCAFSILEQTQHVRAPERLPQVTRQSHRDTLPSRTHARSMEPPHERRSATTSSRLFLFGVIFYGRLCDISCDTIHRPLHCKTCPYASHRKHCAAQVSR